MGLLPASPTKNVFYLSVLRVIVALVLCLGLTKGVSAEESGPACKKAEVNPITGHVLCVDPLGAPVAPPPKADPCDNDAAKAEPRKDGDWTWRPSCTETKDP